MIEEKHFTSIDDVLAHCEEEVSAIDAGGMFNFDGIEHLWTADGVLVPVGSSFSSPYLYRGQVERHRPCVPGVFRGLPAVEHPHALSPADWVRCLVDRVKLEEFVVAMQSHPAMAYAQAIGLRTSPYGLAQHYELATDRIDLTQDHLVAAFFATNKRDRGIWSPVASGRGVVYRLHTASFSQHFGERLECLGKHVLPRPGEQKAYTLTMALGRDFEALPIEVYTFDQVVECGERLHARFAGGSSLFPRDVMADVAAAIRADSSVPRSLLESVMRKSGSPHDIVNEIERNVGAISMHSSYDVSDRAPRGLSDRQQGEAAESTARMKSSFLFGTGALAVRRFTAENQPLKSTEKTVERPT